MNVNGEYSLKQGNEIMFMANEFYFKKLLPFCQKYKLVVLYGDETVNEFAHFMERYFPANRIHLLYMNHIQAPLEIGDEHVGVILCFQQMPENKVMNELMISQVVKNVFYNEQFLPFIRMDAELRQKWQVSVTSVLQSLMGVNFQQDIFYICCPFSVGDTLWIAGLVKAWKSIHGNRTVCLILKTNHADLANLFPSVDMKIVSDVLVRGLEVFSVMTGIFRMENYLYGGPPKTIFEVIPRLPGVKSMRESYHYVLGIPRFAELETLFLPGKVSNPKAYRDSVILMPYAQTARPLPMDFWNWLVQLCKKYKIRVLTNIREGVEVPLPGTEPLALSLVETAEIAQWCKLVISLRSGICDLLALTYTRLVCIDTDSEYRETCPLSDLSERDDLWEVDCIGDWKNSKLFFTNLINLISSM